MKLVEMTRDGFPCPDGGLNQYG